MVLILYFQTYIPLQSFNLEKPLLATTSSGKKSPNKIIPKKKSKSPVFPNANATSNEMIGTPEITDERYSVLKIEEELSNISLTGSKTTSTSTQTNPIHYVANKKDSTSSVWSSEESILRSADMVDEDNKSTSSSACEETGVAMSSDKSGQSVSHIF